MQAWTVLACLPLPYLMAMMGQSFVIVILTTLFWMALCAVWACRLLFRLMFHIPDLRRGYQRPGWRGFAFLPLCLIGMAILENSLLFPKLAFALSRPSLESLVRDRTKNGPQADIRAGLYVITNIERSPRVVRLTLATDGLFCSLNRIEYSKTPTPLSPFVTTNYTQLAPRWYWAEEERPYFD
jgi:hypothetical protein